MRGDQAASTVLVERNQLAALPATGYTDPSIPGFKSHRPSQIPTGHSNALAARLPAPRYTAPAHLVGPATQTRRRLVVSA